MITAHMLMWCLHMISNEYVNNFGLNNFLLQPNFVELFRKVKIHFTCKSGTSTSKSNKTNKIKPQKSLSEKLLPIFAP